MTRRYECGYCGKPRTAEQMIRSRFTGARYCAVEQEACRRRGQALRRKTKRLATVD